MAHEVPFYMPKMSMTMETGELVSWLKAEGDAVRAGEVICEVATDKVDMEVESTVEGTIARIVAQPGDTVPVGEPIAFLSTEADDLMAGLFDTAPDADSTTVTPGSDAPVDLPSENGAAAAAVEASVPSRRGPQPAVPFARRRAVAAAGLAGRRDPDRPQRDHHRRRRRAGRGAADAATGNGSPAPVATPAPAPVRAGACACAGGPARRAGGGTGPDNRCAVGRLGRSRFRRSARPAAGRRSGRRWPAR